MFERFISFLKELPGAVGDVDRINPDDPRLAAAAFMIHVMDVDGRRDPAESARLRESLGSTYGIGGRELDELLKSADRAAHESVDLYSFTSVLKRHLDEEARIEFVRIMWELVFADGEMTELEDNIVWRVAELIGVDRRDRIAMRQRVDPLRRVVVDGDA